MTIRKSQMNTHTHTTQHIHTQSIICHLDITTSNRRMYLWSFSYRYIFFLKKSSYAYPIHKMCINCSQLFFLNKKPFKNRINDFFFKTDEFLILFVRCIKIRVDLKTQILRCFPLSSSATRQSPSSQVNALSANDSI